MSWSSPEISIPRSAENPLPQVFQVQSDTWRDLTSAQLLLDLYPRMHLAPDGRVFNSAPSTPSRSLNTAGTGAWSCVANHSVDVYRDYGSSVMYERRQDSGRGRGRSAHALRPKSSTSTRPVPSGGRFHRWRSLGGNIARRFCRTEKCSSRAVPVDPVSTILDTPVFAAKCGIRPPKPGRRWRARRSRACITRPLVLLPDGRLLSTGGNGYDATGGLRAAVLVCRAATDDYARRLPAWATSRRSSSRRRTPPLHLK